MEIKLPEPPAFLDPLDEINHCYYYSVPNFFPMDHPNTRWMICSLRGERLDNIKRRMEKHPHLFKSSYYQLLDCPKLYTGQGDIASPPLFHSHAVIYINAIAMAVYLRKVEVVKLILEFCDTTGEKVYNPSEPLYATHIQDTINGDFHAFPLWVAVIRSGFYDCVPHLLEAQAWDLAEPACMPMRRRYERRAICYLDWLDYTLALLQDKPRLPIARLVYMLMYRLENYKYNRVRTSILLNQASGEAPPTSHRRGKNKELNQDVPPMGGLINVNELPPYAHMIGTKSLLEVAEEYYCYLQTMERYVMYRELVAQMIQVHLNPQIEMAKANDFDGGYNAEQAEKKLLNNANNNARSESSKRRRSQWEGFVSEPTRILRYTLMVEQRRNNKLPLSALLDAVGVYIRHGCYVIEPKHPEDEQPKSGSGGIKKSATEQQLDEMRRRDARNTVALLLNVIQVQYDKQEELFRQTSEMRKKAEQEGKAATKRDSAAKNFNKRRVLAHNIQRLIKQLFQVLIQSGQLVSFIQCRDPPFQSTGRSSPTDFATLPALGHYFKTIQLEVAAEFNANKSSWSYLSKTDLREAYEIKMLNLNLRVGHPPANAVAKNSSNAAALVDSSNFWPIVADRLAVRPRNIRFVRVPPPAAHPQPKPTQVQEHEQHNGEPQEEGQQQQQQQQQQTTDIAATLTEQIKQLRQQDNYAALADMYAGIVQELQRVAASAKQQHQQQQHSNDASRNSSANSTNSSSSGNSSGDGQAEQQQQQKNGAKPRRHKGGFVVNNNSSVGGGNRRGGRLRCRTRFQKARVFDSRPDGSEFKMLDPEA